MLNPNEEPGLPTIVQVVSDWETGRSLALIPASHPKASGRVEDLRDLDAMWAGPLDVPGCPRDGLMGQVRSVRRPNPSGAEVR
jgi:hypothetical protein